MNVAKEVVYVHVLQSILYRRPGKPLRCPQSATVIVLYKHSLDIKPINVV